MITIGNIVNWERLRGKRFQDFDGGNTDDVTALGYVVLGTREYTLSVYREAALNSGADILAAVAKEVNAEFAYMAQYATSPEAEPGADGEKAEEKESITEIVGALLMGGIDGTFLLSRGLEDLQWLCKAYQHKTRQTMETSRFWAYIQLSPWIDKNKAHNAGEFLPFAWEKPDKDPSVITEFEKKMAAALFGNASAEAVTYERYDGTKVD